MTDARHQNRPGDATEETQCVGVEPFDFGPAFDGGERELESRFVGDLVEDFVGDARTVDATD